MQLLERLVDAWDYSFRFSSGDVLKFQEDAASLFGSCPCLSVISRHADESCAIGLQLKSCLEHPQLDLSSVFNLMQECRKFCCQSPWEGHAASVTQEISEISAKIDFYLECVSGVSAAGEYPHHSASNRLEHRSLVLPSLDDAAKLLSAAEALHFQSPSVANLLAKVNEMRIWCAEAENAIQSGEESLLSAVADRRPSFAHPLLGVLEGKTWNFTAAKIIKSENKQFSLDFAIEISNRGQHLEEASLSVHKSLQHCIGTAADWEAAAQKMCRQKMAKQEAEEQLRAYDLIVKLHCDGAAKLRSHIELAESWLSEWGVHAEKGFEHMCSLPNLRQIIFRYSQFNIQLACDKVMSSLLQFEPGQVKTITDHAARLLTKKIASFIFKMNSGGVSYLIRPDQSVFSCQFECCPWRQASFTSHSDMLLHTSRHVEASELCDFAPNFFRPQCTLQEALSLVEQTSAFDDDSVSLSSHFATLRERIASTQEWLGSPDVKRLINTSDDNVVDPYLQKVIADGIACALHTPQLESLQKHLVTCKVEQAAASSAPLSLYSIEILMNISRNLGIEFPFGKIRFQTTSCDIFASTALQSALVEHRNAVAKVSKAIGCHDPAEFSVAFKMMAAAHPLSPMLPLLAFVGKMADMWKEKALEFLKKSPHDSTSPYLAKTILGWMKWIRWFSTCDSIAKLAKQLQKLSVDYKPQVAPDMACHAATFAPDAPVSCMMLLWPVDDAGDTHLSNATGDRETISLTPRSVVMAPLPPRWYTDAAPEANKLALLHRIKKLGGQIIATRMSCRRRECSAKALTPDSFCSDDCAVQFEMELLETVENSRIKRRAATREALSRALFLSHAGITAAPDVIVRLSASIESSLLRFIPSSADVLPDSYFALLKNRITALRSFHPGCVRGMIVRGIADDTILNHLSSTDISSSASSALGSRPPASTPSSLPSLPVLHVLPSLPEIPTSTSAPKRGVSVKDEDTPTSRRGGRPSKVAKLPAMSYSISISGSSVNEHCHLRCIHNEHHNHVDMASIPSAIVVQGRLAPAAVASFVNQVSSASASSKFIVLFEISLALNHHDQPPSLLQHVRTLMAMDRVAVAPLGEDCQVLMSQTSPPIRLFPHPTGHHMYLYLHPTSDVRGSGLPISAGEHSRATFIQHRRFVRCCCVAQGQARCTVMTVKVVLQLLSNACTLPCIFSFMLFEKCVCGITPRLDSNQRRFRREGGLGHIPSRMPSVQGEKHRKNRDGIRTHDLQLRKLMPYPLGHSINPKAGLEPATIPLGGRIRPHSLTDAFRTRGNLLASALSKRPRMLPVARETSMHFLSFAKCHSSHNIRHRYMVVQCATCETSQRSAPILKILTGASCAVLPTVLLQDQGVSGVTSRYFCWSRPRSLQHPLPPTHPTPPPTGRDLPSNTASVKCCGTASDAALPDQSLCSF